MHLTHRGRLLGCAVTAALLAASAAAYAADQTVPGAGNGMAASLAKRSPLVRTALIRLNEQVTTLTDATIRQQTEDALFNPDTCVVHREHVTEAVRQTILAQLLAAGLYNPADGAGITGGIEAGVFPPVRADGGDCPHLPQPFGSAPGSGFGGHGSYPGGLPVHESFNLSSGLAFLANYELAYGGVGGDGLPRTQPLPPFGSGEPKSDIKIDRSYVAAAPMWHDWAKPIVFQWNADGTEFTELNFGGNGTTDNYGATGDSRTGAHHILSLAESMARQLPPLFILTQASAHSAPTLGNEYKVVNWIRTAAIIAQVDPIARGYLITDPSGHLRLPPVRSTDTVDLNGAGQTNILAEYEIHNLSDADFVFSIPAVTQSQVFLQALASTYGYDPADPTTYNTKYRNPALSFLSGERMVVLYTNGGLSAVKAQLDILRERGVI